jgi:hypothetical protein
MKHEMWVGMLIFIIAYGQFCGENVLYAGSTSSRDEVSVKY